MTRIDHERNGRPTPAEEAGAPQAGRPIERVRPVRVPGAVAGGRRPEPPAEADGAANGGSPITGRWQSVRLRLGEGDPARPDAGAQRGPAPEGESSALRRYRLPLGIIVAGMATAAVVAALAAGDDGTGDGAGTPPPLDRTPPTLNPEGLVPLAAGAGAGQATAAALLTGSGGTLKLTVDANVPGRPYLVGLVGPHTVKGVLGARRGDARRTLSLDWRDLARYDRLALYSGTPASGAPATPSKADHTPTHHSSGGPKGAGGKHAGAKGHGAKGHSSAGAKGHGAEHHGQKHSPARHSGTPTRRAKAHRAATPPPTPILSISVDKLVRASGVHVAG